MTWKPQEEQAFFTVKSFAADVDQPVSVKVVDPLPSGYQFTIVRPADYGAFGVEDLGTGVTIKPPLVGKRATYLGVELNVGPNADAVTTPLALQITAGAKTYVDYVMPRMGGVKIRYDFHYAEPEPDPVVSCRLHGFGKRSDGCPHT
jgi:hypothetical protein